MLYQPVDLPRPVRMQGVFVNDDEVGAVTKHWMDQTGGRTFYDEDILAFADPEDGVGGENGQFAWLRKRGVDEMTIPAAELVMTMQKASTSMLQTKLKLGFSRASRVMDELERYGIIGPQDPRNPASPRQIYGPDNWFTSQATSMRRPSGPRGLTFDDRLGYPDGPERRGPPRAGRQRTITTGQRDDD